MRRNTLIKMYSNVLLKVIKEVDVYTTGRKNKFSNRFYLKYILRILFYGEYWSTFYCPSCHRSTIRKKFYYWSKLGVFLIAHCKLFKKYSKNRVFKNLFIDSTIIQNYNCSGEIIDKYYKMKTKNQIKLSVISDSNRILLSFDISNPKKHDSKFVTKLIKKLNIHTKKTAYLAGDKGYIKKKRTYRRNNKTIRLVTPKRKNQKSIRLNRMKRILLKKRFVIEQLFGHLKRSYKRLNIIHDRNVNNYVTFLTMASEASLRSEQ